jgi:hypothetical protein
VAVKKVRITLKPNSPGRKFHLFPSAEALYVWACALERNETVQVEGIQELVLEPGGFIEAELRGFDYAYDEGVKPGQIPTSVRGKRLDLIRLGKAHEPQNASGTEVSTHAGWVLGNMLPMKRYSDPHIDVVPINEADAKLDLAALFNDEIPVDVED